MVEKAIVILGGGSGGLVAARRLRRRLGDAHRIVMIDRSANYEFAPSFPWIMSGARQPDQVTRDRRRIRRHGIELLLAEVLDIDPVHRRVTTPEAQVAFDFLVVALGAELDPGAVPGFAEAAHSVYTLDGAIRTRDALRKFTRGRVVIVMTRLPYKCPAAPYETAFLVEAELRRRGLREGSSLDIYTPEPFPMPTAGEEIGHVIEGMLAERGIGFHPQRTVQEIDPSTCAASFDNGEVVASDLLIGVPVHRVPGAVHSLCDSGYIPVDRSTLMTETEGVYAIGDVAAVPIAGGKFLPKAGVFAHAEAEVVVHRITSELRDSVPRSSFDGKGACFVELGEGRAAFATGEFFTEGAPRMRLHGPSRRWHLSKVAFEQYWLRRWL